MEFELGELGDHKLFNGFEKVVSSAYPFTGKLIKLEVDDVVLPNGRKTQREMVLHRGAVAIIAVKDGKVLMERQYRHSVKKLLWEIPAGTLEAGENLEECVKRELREETGYVAESIEALVHFYVAPGYSTEVIHIFLAKGLRKEKSSLEEDELLEVCFMHVDDALGMLGNNEIEDAKTIIGLLLAKNKGLLTCNRS
ncbi:MAG: NUDIX hydrolase [Candidatus Bathyarchaeota archaeon]